MTARKREKRRMWEAATDGGLPRNTAELQKTTEPLPVDVPGDGGCLLHSLMLEQRSLKEESNPATPVDLIQDPLALRLGANKANRDWTDGLSVEERTAAQWVDGSRDT